MSTLVDRRSKPGKVLRPSSMRRIEGPGFPFFFLLALFECALRLFSNYSQRHCNRQVSTFLAEETALMAAQ